MPRGRASLIRRLWLASMIVLPVVIGFSALTLNRAFEHSLNRAEADALMAQIYALLGVAELDDGELLLPAALTNPRFETPDSGLYARVLDEQGRESWRSNSLDVSQLRFPPAEHGMPGLAEPLNWRSEGTHYRGLRLTTLWEYNGEDLRFTFDVIHSREAIEAELRRYQQRLWAWLGGMAVVLIALQTGIAYWSLRPLTFLANEIAEIQQGKSRSLSTRYPKEIDPVTTSLNALLQSESAQRERYQNALADLAHSLKTPLSVMRGQLAESQRDQLLDEQVERMTSIISHQLKRANAQVKTIYSQGTELRPLVQRLTQALVKVYREKNMQFDIDIAADMNCGMEENDLLEILGNLIDNACKYGRGWVKISAQRTDENSLQVQIEDNGPGISEELAQHITERGMRADTTTLGQGIGLAIAVDILSSYNGDLKIGRSSAGGAAFHLNLPA